MTFDDLRNRLPSIGMALYAIEPYTPVRLELYFSDGTIMPFTGETEAAVISAAVSALLPAPEAPLYDPQPYVEEDEDPIEAEEEPGEDDIFA